MTGLRLGSLDHDTLSTDSSVSIRKPGSFIRVNSLANLSLELRVTAEDMTILQILSCSHTLNTDFVNKMSEITFAKIARIETKDKVRPWQVQTKVSSVTK